MPYTRAKKEELVASYDQGLSQADMVFLVDFSGISVPQVTELRSRLRETGGTYVVLKNRLALRSAEGKALEALRDAISGPTAAAFGGDDPITVAKVLTEFAKEVPALELKGGLVDGKEVAADEIRELASLPSREELIAKLLFLLQSPVVRMVRTLAELPRRFVVALDQVAAQKAANEGSGS